MSRIVALRVCLEYQFAFLVPLPRPLQRNVLNCSCLENHQPNVLLITMIICNHFSLPFLQYKAFLKPSPSLYYLFAGKFFLEHPRRRVPDSVLLIIFSLCSRLISLCSRFRASKTQGEKQ